MAGSELGSNTAIERALAETARRLARLTTINRIGRIITGSLDLDELLTTAVAALQEHLPFETIALMLVDSDDAEMLVLRARSGVYAVSDLDQYRQSIHVGIAGAGARAPPPQRV
jgi:GAF domain-containing protein